MTALDSHFDLASQLGARLVSTVKPSLAERCNSLSNGWLTARRQLVILWSCVSLITLVSMYDVYWTFKVQDVIIHTEENPIGTWLINVDGGDIALFMTVKMLGTMIVILAIPAIFFFRKGWGLICAVSVAFFQTLLFAYLNFGHLLN